MKKPLLVLSALGLTSLLSVNVGLSAWLIGTVTYEGSGSASTTLPQSEPVAKVVAGSTTTYFTDIGRALKYAYESSTAESIYLIPSLNNDGESTNDWGKTQVTLTSKYANDSFTYDGKDYSRYIVAEGDVLYLPYTGDTVFSGEYQPGYGVIDNSLGNQKSNLKNELIIDEGVLLDIQGDFQIGAIMGGMTGEPDMQNTVQGSYAQISMKKGAKMLYRGTTTFSTNLYGYIKEYDENNKSDGLDILSGAKFKMPLALYDWTGGTWAVSILSDYFPILVYDFPNVQTKLRARYGSTVQALADVSVSNTHYQADVNLVSTSDAYFLQMTGDGYIEFDWDPRSTVTTTTNGETRTIALTENDLASGTHGNSTKEKVTIASNVTMNNLAVEISSYAMSTSGREIPLSYKIDITVKNGYTYTIPDSISAKFLPGSSVLVEEGGNVNLLGDIIAYENFNEAIRFKPYTTKFNVENGGQGAQVINNGSLNIAGSFGGIIQTSNTNGKATINFMDGSNYSRTVSEATSYTANELLGRVLSYSVTYGDSTLTARGYIESSSTMAEFSSYSDQTKIFQSSLEGHYWEVPPIVKVSYSFDSSATNASQILSDAQFTVNGSPYGNTTSSFDVVEGSSFTLNNHYGISHFLVNGERVESGYSVTATEGMKIVAVMADAYKLTATLTHTTSSSTSGSDSTLKITVNDDGNPASSFSKAIVDFDANEKSGTDTLSPYVSVLGKFKVESTNCTSGPTVSGATLGSDGFYRRSGTNDVTVSASGTYYKSCLLPDTLITMPDGSKKPVEDIKAGDYILAFNHETGKKEPSMVLFNDYEEEALVTVLHLDFSGKEVGVIYEHGFFDRTINKYIYLTPDNYLDFLGHEFAYLDESGNIEFRKLSSAYVREEMTECYSPVTYSTLNYFTEDLLSMPGGISGLFNYFDYDPETLAYDEEKKASDINEHGLFRYEDFKDTGLSEEAFNAYNGQYLKVSMAKGLISWETIEYLIERYSKYF